MSKRHKPRIHPDIEPILDVVVTCGGRFDMLKLCLDALENRTSVYINTILIDNATPAEERIKNEDLFQHPVIDYKKRFEQPLGFSEANNEGARVGHAPLILFLNDDVVLEPNALEIMVKRMDEPDLGICGAKLLFPENNTSPIRPAGKVQHIGMGMNARGEVSHPLMGWSKDQPKCNVSRNCFAVTGACLMVRRSLFNKAKGFDLVYGAGTYEDVDLCLKIRQLGARVFVDTTAIGHHYTGATVEKKQQGFPLQQNQMIFMSKWQQSGLLLDDLWTHF